jgi:hypothetical protein
MLVLHLFGRKQSHTSSFPRPRSTSEPDEFWIEQVIFLFVWSASISISKVKIKSYS